MNGYEFMGLTIEFVNDGMSIEEAYETAKEVREALNSIDSGSIADVA